MRRRPGASATEYIARGRILRHGPCTGPCTGCRQRRTRAPPDVPARFAPARPRLRGGHGAGRYIRLLRAVRGPLTIVLRPRPCRGGAAPPRPCQIPSRPRLAPLQRAAAQRRGRVHVAHLARAARAARLDGTTLFVEAPDGQRTWVAERFSRLLRACAATVLGPETRVELVPPGGAPPRVPRPGTDRGREFNPRLTFDQFVIGDSNRLAHARRARGRRAPGPAYNPLFICGAARARQDPPAALDRQLRHDTRRRPHRPLHDGRELHDHFVAALHGGDIEA